MFKIKALLVSLKDAIEFPESDSLQLEETDPRLEEINKTLQVLKRYQDEFKSSQISPFELEGYE